MALKFETLPKHSFPYVKNERKEVLSCPSVGFEWEVPIKSNKLSSTLRSKRVLYLSNKYRVPAHMDGTAIEFASPVSRTLSQSRKVAKEMIRDIERSRFDLDHAPHLSGIHVTVSWPKRVDNYRLDRHHWVSAHILNRSVTKDFLFEFSGRENPSGVWAHQAQATCWDTYLSDGYKVQVYDGCADWVLKGLKNRQKTLYNGSVKNQRERGAIGALEFRVWGAREDRLLPALDFSYAFFKYTSKFQAKAIIQGTPKQIGDSMLKLPSLCDFKVWVNKQDGYNNLKKDPSFINL